MKYIKSTCEWIGVIYKIGLKLLSNIILMDQNILSSFIFLFLLQMTIYLLNCMFYKYTTT